MDQPAPVVPDQPTHPTQAVVVPLSHVQPAPLRWLWPGRIPLGKLSLLLGGPAVGKSLLALDLAARVSAGLPWPDSPNSPNPPAGVTILSAQDDLADMVRPRLEAARADLSRITAITSVRRNILASLPLPLRIASLMPGLSHLEAAIQATPDCRLVIIDPLTRSFGQTAPPTEADTRAVVEPLADLAARYEVAILAIHQTAHSPHGFPLRGLVARLSSGAARAVWAVAPHDDSPDRRLFLPVKNTLSPSSAPWDFSITRSDQHQAPAIAWDDRPSKSSLDSTTSRADRLDACQWLRQALAAGPVQTRQILREAQAVGFSLPSLRLAFRHVHALRARQDSGFAGIWFWALPEHSEQLARRAS
ncbi:MAG: AAA family ATPase [Thermoguttaceae bacterium]